MLREKQKNALLRAATMRNYKVAAHISAFT